jgi:hypothetical protein
MNTTDTPIQSGEPTGITEYKETGSYEDLIMKNIKEFYNLISKPFSQTRNEQVIAEINKMIYIIQIFENNENIEKEFNIIKPLIPMGMIGRAEFDHVLNLIALTCQRIWHRKGVLLTAVPYKEDIYKDLMDKWRKKYPEKFQNEEVKS